jgi:3-deoxy-D-manno-octulosonic-acid transferase
MDVARALYTLAGTALLPFLPLRLWWRGRREPGYRRAWGERFGRYRTPPPSPRVWWVHAVSVGETRAGGARGGPQRRAGAGQAHGGWPI